MAVSRISRRRRSVFAEAETLEELEVIVGRRITYYNQKRRHSSLGNQVPRDYVRRNLAEKE